MPMQLRPLLLALLTMMLLNGCGGGGGAGSSAQSSAPQSFTISGTVSGVYSVSGEAGLILVNNGKDPVTITANGSFSFSIPIAQNDGYLVTVSQQPVNQVCTVSHASGNNVTADIQNVAVMCSVTGVSVAGNVAALPAGAQITLLNNGADPVTLTGSSVPARSQPNGFSFSTQIAVGSSYAVTVGSQPLGQSCTVQNGAASDVVIPVTNVQVNCVPAAETVLYSFTGPPGGAQAAGPLTLGADGNLYGTTVNGGANSKGNFFKVTTAGVYTQLYAFGATGDGYWPNGGMVLGPNGNFYGVTLQGGTYGQGTVFMLTADGSETILHSFEASVDGGSPEYGLTVGPDGYLWGSTFDGSNIFKIASDGSGFLIVHSFTAAGDGVTPASSLIVGQNGLLYGTTRTGGANNHGIFFSLTTAGIETILYSFPTGLGTPDQLTLGPTGFFYGVSGPGAGVYEYGSVFALSSTGDFTLLYNFTGLLSDGIRPVGMVTVGPLGDIYGVTHQGGSAGQGVIYHIGVDLSGPGAIASSGESVVYSFAGGTDAGGDNYGMTVGSDGYLYGASYSGGADNSGAIFRY